MPPVLVQGDGAVTGVLAVDTPRYANAVARDAAVSSTVGKLVFMEDTNALQIYDGSSWVGMV
jgi:hypothetical protein